MRKRILAIAGKLKGVFNSKTKDDDYNRWEDWEPNPFLIDDGKLDIKGFVSFWVLMLLNMFLALLILLLTTAASVRIFKFFAGQ